MRKLVLTLGLLVALAASASGCGGGSPSSSSEKGSEVVADAGHEVGYVYKSATGKGGEQERAEVEAYIQETLGGHAHGECVSLAFEDPQGFDLFDCTFHSSEGLHASFYAVDVVTGKINELGLRLDPDPNGPPEYEHPIPGVEDSAPTAAEARELEEQQAAEELREVEAGEASLEGPEEKAGGVEPPEPTPSQRALQEEADKRFEEEGGDGP